MRSRRVVWVVFRQDWKAVQDVDAADSASLAEAVQAWWMVELLEAWVMGMVVDVVTEALSIQRGMGEEDMVLLGFFSYYVRG